MAKNWIKKACKCPSTSKWIFLMWHVIQQSKDGATIYAITCGMCEYPKKKSNTRGIITIQFIYMLKMSEKANLWREHKSWLFGIGSRKQVSCQWTQGTL